MKNHLSKKLIFIFLRLLGSSFEIFKKGANGFIFSITEAVWTASRVRFFRIIYSITNILWNICNSLPRFYELLIHTIAESSIPVISTPVIAHPCQLIARCSIFTMTRTVCTRFVWYELSVRAYCNIKTFFFMKRKSKNVLTALIELYYFIHLVINVSNLFTLNIIEFELTRMIFSQQLFIMHYININNFQD